MRIIKFRGKRPQGYWAYWNERGLEYDENNDVSEHRITNLTIIPETVGQISGLTICKNRELFEHDIVFEEIENDTGDERYYYVCLWIKEWACFCLFSPNEYRDYIKDGILPDDDSVSNTFIMSQRDCSKLHYAGNTFDNKDLMQKIIY